MITVLTFASFVVAAYGWGGGWNPQYCCYPVPEVCCPTPPPTTEPPCPDCLDVAFVVDISSSIGNVRLQTIINPFLQMFATSSDWDIGTGDGQIQASCTTFANTGDVLWNWMSPETADSAALSAAFGTLQTTQWQGLTNTGDGLEKTRTQVLEGPGNRPDCPDVCIVITDGHVTVEPDLFPARAAAFKDACDLSIVVGITTEVNPDELLMIATSFDDIIMIDEFDQLAGIFDQVLAMVDCPGGGGSGTPAPYTPPPRNPYDCCPYEYPYYYEIMKKW